VRAPASGIFRSNTRLGDKVSKKSILGWIGDPFGENEIEVRAPFSGLVIGRTNLPLVNEGDPVYHLASFHKPTSAAAALAAFRTELDPDLSQAGPSEEPPII
jgi:predicted deacylase